MTAREQLAAQVAAFRAGTKAMVRMVYAGPHHGNPILRAGEVTLECRCDTLRMLVMQGVQGRVNAAEIGGAEAGHLLVVGSRSRVEAHRDGSFAYWLTVRLMYGDQPWNIPGLTPGLYPTADLDALLDALEPGAGPTDVPPARPETWHDRPPLL